MECNPDLRCLFRYNIPMKETLYSRNAVYETLRAKRRQPFSLEIAEGVKEKGRLSDILKIAKERKIPVKRVPREIEITVAIGELKMATITGKLD